MSQRRAGVWELFARIEGGRPQEYLVARLWEMGMAA